jgi:hypothetical protein
VAKRGFFDGWQGVHPKECVFETPENLKRRRNIHPVGGGAKREKDAFTSAIISSKKVRLVLCLRSQYEAPL